MLRFQRTKNPNYRRTKRDILTGTFVFCLCAAVLLIAFTSISLKESPSTIQTHGRKLLGYKVPDADYPPDLFSEADLRNGALILHVIGLFYMFLAIAIVCDEFFVPSIEAIVDILGLSPDVAGATFMAAGGSAPELFTSFFGTFVSKSAVGFGTIVGSAVFNVLFVIGCCAIFSSGDLVLTWYPFARDSTYYCISLIILGAFFSDQTIYFWEAWILFLLYIGYVILMINNAKLYSWLDQKFIKTPERKRAQTEAEQLRPPQAIQTFSVSLFKMMTADANIADIAGIHMVARIKGDVKATFKQVDVDGNGVIDKEEMRAVLQRLGGEVTDEQLDQCYSELDDNDDGKIDYQEFEAWYLKSENRMETDIVQLFHKYDHDNNGYIETSELEDLVAACNEGRRPDSDEVANAKNILDKNEDGKISQTEFIDWYKSSKFFEQQKKRRDTIVAAEEEEEEEGVSLKWPQSTKARIMYCISIPIVATLYFTVPDVRKPRWAKWWLYSFFASIAWLGVYSYFMVWWATIIGKIIGIPDAIMGLTILAAGTSVPDLITSVLVAKEGHGDMAVSSSIGSNIFDILVGLPLPWIFATFIDWPSYSVQADGIFISIFILFIMIAAVLIIIKCSKWRMTKTLGYSMFVLYVIFCIQDILRNCELMPYC